MLFSNMGLVAIAAVLIPKWYNEEELLQDKTMGVLAMIFLIFFTYN